MNFEAKVIEKSRKKHTCIMCSSEIPVGSLYVASPYKDEADGTMISAKFCHECAYLMNYVTVKTFSEGNFSDRRIPNFLRKIRNEYRKNPKQAWENINK